MSWTEKRPITGKLPINSGNWQGNETVETLTGYWDDFLCDLKDNLDNPTWISANSPAQFLDWIGLGLCGYGKAWDLNYSEDVKRRLIQNFTGILKSRGSEKSIKLLINSVIPGSTLIHYPIQMSDLSYADLSAVSDYPNSRYMICLPTSIQRDGIEWVWMKNLLKSFMPVGEISLQYQVNLPNRTLAGDWSVN